MNRLLLTITLAWTSFGSLTAQPLFELLSPEQSGITFKNALTETPQFNRLNYEYFYNGGGVAVGDINNDNLPDLYFTGNQVEDKLYLNEGGLKFRDISKVAGIKSIGWHTGVSMIDINDDGWLDIYVCRSGLVSPQQRTNLLYVNNGNSTFTERAAQYGIADTGHSVQAAFFDYDNDGDLDMYLLSHPVIQKDMSVHDYYKLRADGKHESDRLYRNDGPKFTDVTREAGLFDYGFRHGIAVGDVNQDGWPDLYVCSDFDEPDRLYINKGGKFEDQILQLTKHISMFSMGVDIADFNNDGMLDIYAVDMTPEGHLRSKTNMAAMSIPKFWQMVKLGFHHQYMVNTLQLNTGKGFSEIAQVAGVSKTDWSWAPLFADFDNDGWKDLFVTNGIKRDVLDNDARIKIAELTSSGNPVALDNVLALMPQNVQPNYMFRNKGALQFENVAASWGVGDLVNSNGAAYSDLDRDGDLDLVLNNVEEVAYVYRNMSSERNGGKYLSVKLDGPPGNRHGIGAKVTVAAWSSTSPTQRVANRMYQELYLTRGYLSGVEPVLNFGLGNAESVDVAVVWPDGRITKGRNAKLSSITVSWKESQDHVSASVALSPIMPEVTELLGLTLRHHENDYDDFKRELLIPHKQSEHVPLLSTGDVNGDGLTDFYFPGSKGLDGQLMLQRGDGLFSSSQQEALHDDATHEDAGSLFFDADGDKDLDLYIASGGNEEEAGSQFYQDRLYINDGQGGLTRDSFALPPTNASGSVVIANDIDADGDEDLFVGGRVVPGGYPEAPQSYLLINSHGKFSDARDIRAPGLSRVGMVTDAVFSDYDSDGDADLLIVGEWMPLVIYRNDKGSFTRTEPQGIGCSSGWWFTMTASDMDDDGDDDYILGNLGWNNKFHPTQTEPLKVYANDFDRSGTRDIVLAKTSSGNYVPVRGRECSSQQMPFITQKYPTYRSFAEASIDQIYEDGLSTAIQLEACEMSSVVLWNKGSGSFQKDTLPVEAQLAPLRGVVVIDLNGDGKKDIIGAGNMYGAEVETVRYDAGIGVCLLQLASGFKSVSVDKTGFYVAGDVRDVKLITVGDKKVILVANNRGKLQAFEFK